MKTWIESVLPQATALNAAIEEHESSILFCVRENIYIQCNYYQKHDFLMVVCSLAAPFMSYYPPEPHFFSFLTSFWKGYAKEKQYSFVVIKMKSSTNLTQEFLDDIYHQFSKASFYDLKSFSEKSHLVNHVRENHYWIFEEKKESSNKYMDALNSILYAFENEKEQNELFSFKVYLENLWINGISFSFYEKDSTVTFCYLNEKKAVLVSYQQSGEMKKEMVNVDRIRPFINYLLKKKKNENRVKHLFDPPKKYFYKWINTFSNLISGEQQESLYQEFLQIFNGDYHQVEVMSKRLVTNPNLLKSYPVFHGHILYCSILEKHFVIGFNKSSLLFSSVKKEDMKAGIMDTIEKISASCIQQDLQEIDSK